MRLHIFFLIGALLGLAGPCLYAQEPVGQISEREIERQTRFIEANRELLLGNDQKAYDMLIELYDDDPENDALAFALGRASSRLERHAEAVEYLRQALQADPDNEFYREHLAETLHTQGAHAEAAEAYEQLVRQKPKNEGYYLRWAYFLVQANDLDAAIRVYDRLEQQVGVSEEIIRRKHALYLGQGRLEQAAAELQRLIDAFPTAVEYRHNLAVFYEETGQPDRAEAVYRDILDIAPDDPRALLALAGQAAPASDDLQYLEQLAPVLTKPEVEVELKVQRLLPIVQRVAETGDTALAGAALELTRQLEAMHPESAEVFATSADLLFHSGRIREAIAKYEATLALDDTVFAVWEQLLNAYFHEGRYDDLRDRAEEAMDFFPNKPIAYFQYGRASLLLGEPEDALDAFEQALLMSAANPQMNFLVQSQLGLVYAELEDYDRSEAAFEGALALQPGQPDVQRAYAASLAGRGVKLERALELADQALEQRPGQPEFLDTYGWVLYKQESYKRAEQYLQQALDQGGATDPTILEHFGDLNFQLGREEQAIRYWNLALERGPGSPLLEKKINDKQLYE